MRIARFWHREFVEVVGRGGARWRLSCWGWSAQSADEARERAAAKGDRIKEWWKPGGARQDASWYALGDYLADPPREEVVEEIADEAGAVVGLVTRNAYGALILNTDRMVIVDVDEYYLKLCRRQKTFRARLTAKPWRCGSPRAPHRFPREEPDAIRAFEAWEAEYSRRAIQYRACRLLRGDEVPLAPDLAALVRLHDNLSQTTSQLPLA